MGITLDQLLSARDARAAYTEELRRRYPGACVVVFTVITPGAEKQTEAAKRLFDAGVKALLKFIARYEIAPLEFEAYTRSTGDEAYMAIRTEPCFLKMELCVLEETALYGRLWDMDVVKPDGEHISREDVGFGERSCIVCGRPGRTCYSRRLHSPEDVQKAVVALVDTLPD